MIQPVFSQVDSPLQPSESVVQTLLEVAEFTDDPQVLDQRIATLKALEQSVQDPETKADVQYHLGLQYIWADQHYAAFRALDRAAETDLSIHERHPVAPFRDAAYKSWLRGFAPAASRGAAVVLGVFFLCLFIFARVRQRKAGGLFRPIALMVLGWTVVFGLAAVIQSLFSVSHLDAYLQPVLVRRNPFSPGGEALRALFLYGLLAAVSVPIIYHALKLLPRRPRQVFAPLLTLVFALVLTGDFYLHHLFDQVDWPAADLTPVRQASSDITSVVVEIKTIEDIPEDMKPLYDEDFWKDEAPYLE
jgi:hypothetical protein